MTNPNNEALPLWHQSGVNREGEPFIQLLLGDRIIAQMTPEDARSHAQAVIESAEASEQDAFMIHFFRTKLGVDFNEAGQILIEFRKFRQEESGKRGGPTNRRDWVMPEERP
jgi:hypothetical protein